MNKPPSPNFKPIKPKIKKPVISFVASAITTGLAFAFTGKVAESVATSFLKPKSYTRMSDNHDNNNTQSSKQVQYSRTSLKNTIQSSKIKDDYTTIDQTNNNSLYSLYGHEFLGNFLYGLTIPKLGKTIRDAYLLRLFANSTSNGVKAIPKFHIAWTYPLSPLGYYVFFVVYEGRSMRYLWERLKRDFLLLLSIKYLTNTIYNKYYSKCMNKINTNPQPSMLKLGLPKALLSFAWLFSLTFVYHYPLYDDSKFQIQSCLLLCRSLYLTFCSIIPLNNQLGIWSIYHYEDTRGISPTLTLWFQSLFEKFLLATLRLSQMVWLCLLFLYGLCIQPCIFAIMHAQISFIGVQFIQKKLGIAQSPNISDLSRIFFKKEQNIELNRPNNVMATTFSKFRPIDWTKADHRWEISNKPGIFYCNNCQKIIGGILYTAKLECKICGQFKHSVCHKSISKLSCKFITTGRNNLFSQHQWVVGNLPINSMCEICKLVCGSIYSLEGCTCIYCQRVVHQSCKEKLNETCDFGELRQSIIFPSEVKVMKLISKSDNANDNNSTNNKLEKKKSSRLFRAENIEIKFQLLDQEKCPIIAVVNKLSGGQIGQDILNSFYRYLNPIQVIDLIDEGLEKLKLFAQLKNCRVIVGGGDGTVGSVLTYIKNEIILTSNKARMPVAVLPLGTGNDMSRALGWGGTFTTKDVKTMIRKVADKSEPIVLDRWKVTITQNTSTKTQYLYNYLGIGLDAKFAFGFHQLRQKYPKLFKSQLGNKFIYGQMGTVDWLMGKNVNLAKAMTLKCDDVLVNIPDLECIIIQNIEYWGGGVHNIWGDEEPDNQHMTSEYSDANVVEYEKPSMVWSQYRKQSMYDGAVEVVGFSNVLHMGQAQGGFTKAKRVCQGSNIELQIKKSGITLAVQIDGEPFELKSPFTITIGMNDKVDVLVKRSDKRLSAETKIIKVLDWAIDNNHITQEQQEILLDRFLKEIQQVPQLASLLD